MKKNYLLLLLSLSLTTSIIYSSDDNKKPKTITVPKRPELIPIERLINGAVKSFDNLATILMLFKDHLHLFSRNELPSSTSTEIKTSEEPKTKTPEKLKAEVFLKKIFEILKTTNNQASLIVTKHNQSLRTFHYIYQEMLPPFAQDILKTHYNLLIKQCTHKFPFLTNKTEGFNDPYNEENISFESPYLENNNILKRIIFENSQAIQAPQTATFIGTISKSTNNNIKGVIFNGPPGTGKTETARALAKKLDVPFVFKKVSEIFSTSFIGTASQRVKTIFKEARDLAKTSKSKNSIKVILLLDEIDNLVIKRVTNQETLSSEHGGSILRDYNATITSFMDEFNASALNEGILVVGTTNNNNPNYFEPALISRFNYGMITFEKPTLEERTAYIYFYVQKTIALKLKNIWETLNISTLPIDKYMDFAETIMQKWYYSSTMITTLENKTVESPLLNLATESDGLDLRQITELINTAFSNQSKRLHEHKNQEIDLMRSDSASTPLEFKIDPHQALITFKKWPFDEQCKKQILLKALSKLHLTKKALPWISFCTTLGISTALIPSVIKITPQILEFIHKKNPIQLSRYTLSKDYQEKLILGLYIFIAGYTALKATTKAHALSQPIIDTDKLLIFYSNELFKITKDDIESTQRKTTQYC